MTSPLTGGGCGRVRRRTPRTPSRGSCAAICGFPSAPVIGARIPERAGQPDRGEDRDHLGGRGSTRLDGEPIRVPGDGEAPELREADERALRQVTRAAPGDDVL